MAAGKNNAQAAAIPNAASASALELPGGFGGEARTSSNRLKPNVRGKLRSFRNQTVRLSQLASRLPAPGQLLDDGPEAQGTTGQLAAQSSRQFVPT